MARKKKQPGTSVVVRPRLIPQRHGGAIPDGGVPGNKGGGRDPTVTALKANSRRLIEQYNLQDEMAMIAAGLSGEIKTVYDPINQVFEKRYFETPAKDRIAAFKALQDGGDVSATEKSVEGGGTGKHRINVFVLGPEEKAS